MAAIPPRVAFAPGSTGNIRPVCPQLAVQRLARQPGLDADQPVFGAKLKHRRHVAEIDRHAACKRKSVAFKRGAGAPADQGHAVAGGPERAKGPQTSSVVRGKTTASGRPAVARLSLWACSARVAGRNTSRSPKRARSSARAGSVSMGPSLAGSARGASSGPSARLRAMRPPSEHQGESPMKAAVVTFPGSNCDRDLAVAFEGAGFEVTRVWHKDSALPAGVDVVGVPGGFSFGDYLRCGAIAAQSPISAAIRAHADRGGYVLGICNGFQVITEMGLLPGVLMRNATLKFVCRTVTLKVATTNSDFTSGLPARPADPDSDRASRRQLHDRRRRTGAAEGRRPDRLDLCREPQRQHGRHRRGPVGEPSGAGDDAASRTGGRCGAWWRGRARDVRLAHARDGAGLSLIGLRPYRPGPSLGP